MSSESKVIHFRRWGLALGILLLVLLIAAVYIFFISDLFTPRQMVSMDINRPLVLFQSPNNHEQLETGSFTIVHVTARSSNGISKIELWVNGVKVGQTNQLDIFTENLTLTHLWLPTTPGNHTLVARAFSLDGAQAYSTITVFIVERNQLDDNRHTVREGEDLDSIADLYGFDPDDLLDLNPDIIPEDLGPGDDLVLPEDDDLPTDPDLPEIPDDDPPDDDPPVDLPPEDDEDDDSLLRLGDILDPEDDVVFFPPLDEIFPGPGSDRVGLRIELIKLLTSEVYELLYCYIGTGGNLPERYPRASEDDDTVSSFAVTSLDYLGLGMVQWRLDRTIVDDSQITVYWPRNRSMPIYLACFAISDGGTTRLDLGHLTINLHPNDWVGYHISNQLIGEDGFVFVTYRVHRVGIRESALPGEPDLTMTPPVNARLNHPRGVLSWDYSPNLGEEIDGFRIYLNNNLQWVENAQARESQLPFEWLNPPCDTTYQFSVTAFRYGSPYGPESLPAVTELDGPRGDCQREIAITFLTLQTFDLGPDRRFPAHQGDVGPIYGHFKANDDMVGFDTRDIGGYGGRLDIPQGLRHHSVYDLGEMAADPSWGFSRMPQLIVETPMEGSIQFGFHIMDEDFGWCIRPTDPGCDDLVCEFESELYTGIHLDQHHQGTMLSEDGRCQVTYRWGPAFGSPVGTDLAGSEPLPALIVEDVFIDGSSGAVSIEVRNIGTAAWPRRDLTVELQDRWGFSQGMYTWQNFDLGPGMRTVLTHPAMSLTHFPFDTCVLIDPYDDVLELYESIAAWTHQPYCPPLSDLSISNVHVDFTHGGRLHVSVHNGGDGPIRSQAVPIHVFNADEMEELSVLIPDVSIAPRATSVLVVDFPSEALHRLSQSGYQVVVNPRPRQIAETNYDNNSFTVAPSRRLWVHFYSAVAPQDLRNRISYTVEVSILSGTHPRQVAYWQVPRRIDWDRCITDSSFGARCMKTWPDQNHSYWFDILGSESLKIAVSVNHYWRAQYNAYEPIVFDAETLWGSGPQSSFWDGERCVGSRIIRDARIGSYQSEWSIGEVDGTWAFAMIICREGD